ncbi:MAG: 30S ribosomal protein S18 alanine N-acetyltransferase [Alphaproteobacteria bacterium]|nr:30S ribosomal protein S18 alanine N-acetyltransferase [Alphaproteobacteria bacterium]
MVDPVIVPVGPEAAGELSRLHALCFAPLPETPWSETAVRTILHMPGAVALTACGPGQGVSGLLIGRKMMDEAEVLTLCVAPDSRKGGLARTLLQDFISRMGDQARIALEVAVENEPAIALYRSMGFSAAGRRPGYYAARGRKIDALVLVREPIWDPNSENREKNLDKS